MIRVVHPGFWIPDPDADFLPSRIPDPGVKKAPNPGSGSATLQQFFCCIFSSMFGHKNFGSESEFDEPDPQH